LNFASSIFKEAQLRNYHIGFTGKEEKKRKILDIGGGFPVKYTPDVKSFSSLSEKLNRK